MSKNIEVADVYHLFYSMMNARQPIIKTCIYGYHERDIHTSSENEPKITITFL